MKVSSSAQWGLLRDWLLQVSGRRNEKCLAHRKCPAHVGCDYYYLAVIWQDEVIGTCTRHPVNFF